MELIEVILFTVCLLVIFFLIIGIRGMFVQGRAKWKKILALVWSLSAALFVFFGVPIIGMSTKNPSVDATSKRNAQRIASIYSATLDAGHNFVVSSDDDLTEVVANICKGVTVDTHLQAESFFGAPDLSGMEHKSALRFLELREDRLVYKGNF